MATTATATDGGVTGKDAKPKSKKKLIIAIVVVLALAGGVYKFVLAPQPKPGPAVGGDYVVMDPTTLNLADGHYLKVGLAIQLVKGKATKETFDSSHASELVIDEFTGRAQGTLTNAMRQKLAQNLGADIKKAYTGEVYTTYLTQFVIQ